MAPPRRAIRLQLERYRLLSTHRRLRGPRHDTALPGQGLLDAAPEGVIGLDLDGRITFANPAATGMLGYTAGELQGQPIRTHMQFTGAGSVVPDLPLGQESCWREDGTSFPVECDSAPVRVGGRIVGSVVTFRDISKRQAVEQMKDELISVVSHELRTPLTSIRSALGLLVSGVVCTVPDKGQRMLQIAVKTLTA